MSQKKIKRKLKSVSQYTSQELDIIKLLQSGKPDDEIVEILAKKDIAKSFTTLTNLYKKIQNDPTLKKIADRLK